MERAPARAMLRAVGMTDDDWGKAQVGVASSWNEVTPCNMPLDRLAKRAKEGVRDAGRLPDRVRHDRGQRRHLDGPRGHARLAREPRDHRRLGRVRDALGAARRAGDVRRLRQEPAGDAHGRRPHQPAVGVPLRRFDPARPLQGPGARHRQRVRGGRRVRGRHASPRTSSARSRRAPARPRVRARGCSPPTRWRRSARRSACRCPGRPRAPAVDRRRDDYAYESGRAVMRTARARASGRARS